jgi:hypothetical protein
MKRILIPALIALGLTAAACGEIQDPTATNGTVSQSSTNAKPASTEEAGPSYDNPSKSDFGLSVKTLTKECFGSAGCNVTFRIKVAMNNAVNLDPDKTYEVTYKVRGGDEPLINTLEITGSDYSTDSEELISTSSSSAKLTAVVTDIEEA